MSTLETLLGSDRAEDLDSEQVLKLFAGSGGDEAIVDRLMSGGAYLLQGSRGTGKTMLLRVAYERLKRSKASSLPVFVSFSRYLSTYGTQNVAEGYSPFQSWVFAKLLSGMRSALEHSGGAIPFGPVPLDKYVERLECHYQDPSVADPSMNAQILGVSASELVEFARPDNVQKRVLSILDYYNRESVAFFLDEAAQNFAEELQPQFFQLMRHLRHHRISVKAAVYPNTTNYGRDFDVGQDAIILPVERPIETTEGMSLFHELVSKRFANSEFGEALEKSERQVRFLIKTSGGNPRWFIHLLSRLNHQAPQPITSTQAMAVAKELPEKTLWPYLQNLKIRLRSKRKYVDTAIGLAQTFVEGLRESNKQLRHGSPQKPTCYVAISTHRTIPFRVHAAIRLLQYAGIIFNRGPKKISGRDTADMWLIHPAILVSSNALWGGEINPSLEAWVDALSDPPKEEFKEYTRNSPKLLEFRRDDEADGSDCSKCGAVLSAGSKFCSQCGAPVSQSSPYDELLSRPVGELELTPGVKQRIVDDGRFPSVGSIVKATDDELDSIVDIGKIRIKLIRYAAEEFLAG